MDRPITTRKQAIADGNDKYSTGKPCKNNHFPLRYVKNGQCIECNRMYVNKNRNKIGVQVMMNRSKVVELRAKIHKDALPGIWSVIRQMNRLFEVSDQFNFDLDPLTAPPPGSPTLPYGVRLSVGKLVEPPEMMRPPKQRVATTHPPRAPDNAAMPLLTTALTAAPGSPEFIAQTEARAAEVMASFKPLPDDSRIF